MAKPTRPKGKKPGFLESKAGHFDVALDGKPYDLQPLDPELTQFGKSFVATGPGINTKDSFWSYKEEIDTLAWNTLYPYQLMILDEKSEAVPGWTFTLPVPPQELSLAMPMAINTTPTFGGIVEEHNGAPFRMISLSGTTGVNAERGAAKSIKSYSEAQSAIRTSVSVNQAPIPTAGGIAPGASGLVRTNENTNWLNVQPLSAYASGEELASTTGYYQFRLLQRFLEGYVNLKKKASGAKYRLAFAIWKDEAVYIVTPVQFEVKRSASSPLEYMYSLQLRAWKRIVLESDFEEESPQAANFSPGYMQQRLVAAQQSKNFFDEAYGLYKQAQRAYNAVFDAISKAQEISRQAVGYLKMAINVGLFVTELSPELLAKLAQEEGMRWARLFGYEPALITKSSRLYNNIFGATTPQQISTIGVGNVVALARKQQAISPNSTPVEVDSLELSPTLRGLIEKEKQSYRNLGRSDFESMRDDLMAAMAQFSASVGLSTTNQTANESTTQTVNAVTNIQTTEPSELDYQTMFQMNRLAMVLNSLAASNNVNPAQQFTPMDYVAGLATRSSIAFKVPQSKYGVPFPYGYTLEQLARDYLKNPNRWMEIATLNGLQAPYVDEVGVTVDLAVNGAERTLVVELPADATIERGQSITIASNTVPREKRVVQQVDKRDSVTVIRVDGEPDLSKFTVNGKASIHFYRPNTVNSQMMIYIPSDAEPTQQDYATKSIPGLANLQQMIAAGGVDLQLTNAMDLAVTPDGDCKLAIGLTNLIQRVRIAFSTPPGGLLQHPGFGLGLTPGISTADLSAESILNKARDYFRSDAAFSGVQSVLVNKSGPSLAISLTLGVRGLDQLLPVTLEVKQ